MRHNILTEGLCFDESCIDCVEHGTSVVERRTRNRESTGSNPPLLPFRSLGIFVFLHDTPVHWLPGYRRWWKCDRIVFARKCCMARMLAREVELVSEWTGLPGEERVNRFERSNGLDSALYKNYLYLFLLWVPAGVEIALIRLSGLSKNVSGQVDCPTEVIRRTSRYK